MKDNKCFEKTNGGKCQHCNKNTTCEHGIAGYEKYLKREEELKKKSEKNLKKEA